MAASCGKTDEQRANTDPHVAEKSTQSAASTTSDKAPEKSTADKGNMPEATAQKAAVVNPPAAPAAPPRPKPASREVKWDAAVGWADYDSGMKRAAAEDKAAFLIVYADWCPKCRSLGPELSGESFINATKDLVMIKADQSTKPGWLSRYSEHGTYVPRIFMLKPDGTIRQELKSPHPRYPYFYTKGQVRQLIENMKKAASGA